MVFRQRHPGDARDVPMMSRAPTDAALAGIRDVLVVPTTYVEGDFADEPPAGHEAIQLGADLALERLSHEDAELVFNACTQRGHYFFGVRQFGQRYSFVRHRDPDVFEQNAFAWDEDHILFYAVALSRLVHDNGHSLQFAARIVDHDDGEQQVIPVYAPGVVATYRLRRGRDWLTPTEAEELRQLLADYLPLADALPWKVSHALNLSEDAVHMQLLPREILLICTGLDGLLQSDRTRVAKQFRERLPCLAEELGIAGVDEEFAQALYVSRSEVAHGAPLSAFEAGPALGAEADEPEQPHGEPEHPEANENEVAPFALAQDVLRAASRKAIEDGEFRAVFESEDSVRARWPVAL
jgi:hypothetical protein